jgi:hypothetical protein
MVDKRQGGASYNRQVLALNKGLLTDVSALGRPDGSSLDEENVDLLRDGSRRRRKGLQYEANYSLFTLNDTVAETSEIDSLTSTFASHRWTNVAGNPDRIFIVVKVGVYLHFYVENKELSANKLQDLIDLRIFATTAFQNVGADYTYISNQDFTFADANGHLFVASAHTKPFFLKYNVNTGKIEFELIDIRMRDFVGVNDGVPLYEQPESGSGITDSHLYNLLNRGWTLNNINNYKDGQLAAGSGSPKNKWPAKNMIPFKAMVRHESIGARQTNIYQEDWTKKFDANVIESQLFGNNSATQGALLLDPFDTRSGRTVIQSTKSRDIDEITCPGNIYVTPTGTPGVFNYEIDLYVWFAGTGTPNFDGAGEVVTFKDTVIRLPLKDNGPYINVSLDGYTNTVSAWNENVGGRDRATVKYYYTGKFYNPGEEDIAAVVKGSLTNKVTYTRPGGYITYERPRAVASFAGRIFYAGTNHPELADKLFFSQLTLSETDAHSKYGKMYQEQDPTSEFLNELLPTDGGVIEIAGLGSVVTMVPLQNSLIILTKNGIWELNGGNQYFSATNIFVRKIADVEVVSPYGVTLTDQGLMVASPSGVYVIRGDDSTNLLTADSVTYGSIQSLWLSIPIESRNKIIALYNDLDYKVSFFYQRDTSYYFKYAYDTALIFDLRQEAWTKHTFDNYVSAGGLGVISKFIHGVVPLNARTGCSCAAKFRYLIYNSDISVSPVSDTMTFAELTHNHTTFNDVMTGTEKPAYIITNYDLADAYANYKYAPYLITFCHKVETGYTQEGEDLAVANEGGLLVQGLFNFATGTTSNKWTTAQQAYRPGPYAPVNINDTDGFGVYASKLKLRGRGRSVAIKYSSETNKDFHLAGFAMEYKIERNI